MSTFANSTKTCDHRVLNVWPAEKGPGRVPQCYITCTSAALLHVMRGFG